jgi:hypothetical protein
MKLLMKFEGGPLEGLVFAMDRIRPFHLCLDPRDERVLAYVREEMVYVYDAKLSSTLSAAYGAVERMIQERDDEFPEQDLVPAA